MSSIGDILRNVVQFPLPPRCAGCGQIVGDDLELCVTCWLSLSFLTGTGCELCGVPLAPHYATCAPCLAQPPYHDGAYAAVAYNGVARNIALKLKHGRRIGLAKLIARLIAPRCPEDDGILVPVPLHRMRIWQRGFNQSALIARHLADLTGLRMCVDLLKRTKSTPSLRGLSAVERSKTVNGAFSVLRADSAQVKGRTIFLVDDVYTSGATGNACARVLKRAGARKVVILCWARVIRDDTIG